MEPVKILFERVSAALNKEDFSAALALINTIWEDSVSQQDFFLQLKCIGFLIDLGSESSNKDELNRAINFLETNEIKCLETITSASYYYNLGNARSALFKCEVKESNVFPNPEIIRQHLNQAKANYWTAYKASDKSDRLQNQILINLANTLLDTGRIIEAIQFYDSVLFSSPDFPQANISKADTLDYLIRTSTCSITVALLSAIFKCYERGIKSNALPPSLHEKCKELMYRYGKMIEQRGFNISEIENELLESNKEYLNHTPFRKFCLDNFLSLSEHALYCKCVAAEKDDLQIGVANFKSLAIELPKMELLLNRLKSEFSLARHLFYKATQEKIEKDESMLYTEIMDKEEIGLQTEMLRGSFRICFGLLDKVAQGLCKFYNLPRKPNEPIYFESFWKSTSDRWSTINSIKNIHLTALYAIATDLNTKGGELGIFKNWRNKLEHNLLVLKEDISENNDPLRVFSDPDFIEVISISDFREKTLHLLQLCRAAIFSFTYCIRHETIIKEDIEAESVIIGFKNH